MSEKNLPDIIQKTAVIQGINPATVNLMLPTQTYGQVLGAFDKLTIEVVVVDPDPKQGDVYEISTGKFALGKRPLTAMANAMGIVWDPKETTILESTVTKSRAKATGAMRKANGEWIVLSDEKTIDLAIIDDERLKLQKRKFKDELAMTGAKERVIRNLLAIKTTYSKDELSKPIAFPRVTTDTAKLLQDPEMRRAAIDRMSGSVSAIFGPGRVQNGDIQDVIPDKAALPEPTIDSDISGAISDTKFPAEEEAPPPFESEEETLRRRLRSYVDDADGGYAVLKKAGAIDVIEALLNNNQATLKALQDMDKKVQNYLARIGGKK